VDGIALPHVVTPTDVLAGPLGRPGRAVVFDDLGNYHAVGPAELLLEQGSEVVFATSFAELAPDLFRSFQRDAVAARLAGFPEFRLLTRCSVQRITPETVVLRGLDGGREETVEADLVVMATGFDSHIGLLDELRDASVPARPAGDAVAPLLLPHAIASGRAAGLEALATSPTSP
jgi:hypothetical protein